MQNPNSLMSARSPLAPAPVKQSALSYKTGFNADRQGINTGAAQQNLDHDTKFKPTAGSAGGIAATADLQKSQQFNDRAQLNRGIEVTNAGLFANNQSTRADLMQTGLSNQAKIYSDISQRANDQVGLAAQMQEAQIRNRYALNMALLK